MMTAPIITVTIVLVQESNFPHDCFALSMSLYFNEPAFTLNDKLFIRNETFALFKIQLLELLNMNSDEIITITIMIVLIIIILVISVGKSKAHQSSSTSPRQRPMPKRQYSKRGSSRGYLPVKTVCMDLHISPTFHPHRLGIDIELDVRGGIAPYSYEWEDGSNADHYNNADANEEIFLKVTDARGCVTEKTIITPPSN